MTQPASSSVGNWAAYCTAHVGKSLLWAGSDLLTLYVLVTLYAMDPIVAGGLFLVALAANALADLAVGIWLDRHPGHAAALAGGGLCVCALTFPLTMLLAPHGAMAVLVAMLVFRIAYSGYDVPHNALMTALAPSPTQATWLSRGRTIGTGLAGLAIAWCARGATDPETVAPLLWMIAFAAFLIGLAILPILRGTLLAAPVPRTGGRFSLPLPFLAASVVGIVALGALSKAVLHLPSATVSIDGPMMLLLLTLGRTASALVPLRISDARRGLALLGLCYFAAAAIAAAFTLSTAAPLILALGLAMGVTNLIGWALLPSLACGARGYGLYTMVSKLALGAVGLALAGGLGRAPMFTAGGFVTFVWAVALGCVAAALLAWPRLTSRARRAYSPR